MSEACDRGQPESLLRHSRIPGSWVEEISGPGSSVVGQSGNSQQAIQPRPGMLSPDYHICSGSPRRSREQPRGRAASFRVGKLRQVQLELSPPVASVRKSPGGPGGDLCRGRPAPKQGGQCPKWFRVQAAAEALAQTVLVTAR